MRTNLASLCKSSSKRWLERQKKDIYVQMALKDGFRARSAYKLKEIDQKFHILKPGSVAVECGAAPGAWTQVMVKRIRRFNSGTVVSCDLLDFEPVKGAHILTRADFTAEETQNQIKTILEGSPVDLVLSDMAPKASGQGDSDHDNIVKLAMVAARFAIQNSKQGATFLCKLWDGRSTNAVIDQLLKFYSTVERVKPKSSRKESAELFLLAMNFKGISKSN